MAEFVIIAALVKILVDVFYQSLPLGGIKTNLFAAALGCVFAFGFGLEYAEVLFGVDYAGTLDKIVTGVAVGLGASAFHEVATSREPSSELSH